MMTISEVQELFKVGGLSFEMAHRREAYLCSHSQPGYESGKSYRKAHQLGFTDGCLGYRHNPYGRTNGDLFRWIAYQSGNYKGNIYRAVRNMQDDDRKYRQELGLVVTHPLEVPVSPSSLDG